MWDTRIIKFYRALQLTSTMAHFNNTDLMVALSLFRLLHSSISNFNLVPRSSLPRYDYKAATHLIPYSISYARLIGMVVGYNTMLNYQLFQKFKLLGNNKFNHLSIILTSLTLCESAFFVTLRPKDPGPEWKKEDLVDRALTHRS